MDVVVIGAGAIGGWIAAKLAATGSRVAAITSRGPLETITLEEAGSSLVAQLSPFEGPADLLVIAVKATALEAAATAAAKRIGEHTIIVPMLNGVPWWFVPDLPLSSVDPSGTVSASLPFRNLIGCVVHASCYRTNSGTVVVKHADRLIIGEPLGGCSNRVEAVQGLLEAARIRCEASESVRRAIWYKLWGNATINPLSALTRASCDRILAEPECRSWMLEGMAELAAIGAAIGCPISESGEDRMAVTARLGAFKTSMLQDVEFSRPIELEALLGAPREIARRHGIETPALDRLYGVTSLMARSLGLL
jgi:2-dehydropantoate 2-reductase